MSFPAPPFVCLTLSLFLSLSLCLIILTMTITLHQASDGCQFTPHTPCISPTANKQAPLSWQDVRKITALEHFTEQLFINLVTRYHHASASDIMVHLIYLLKHWFLKLQWLFACFLHDDTASLWMFVKPLSPLACINQEYTVCI